MKKIVSFVAALLYAATTFAQVDEVTLTVLGTGRTEGEAINTALRSAIEQSFGTFVSANTTILNDQLVRDEIVSVSKGNIKNYEKLAVSNLPNGQVGVSLKATVSVNKLISYAKSKGSRAEFEGQTYAANVKLIKLKVESTKKALDMMLAQMNLLADDLFDFDITIGEPYLGTIYENPKYSYDNSQVSYKTQDKSYILPCQINVYSNIASTNFANIYYNTMKSLNLSDEEVRLCKNNQIDVTNIISFDKFSSSNDCYDDCPYFSSFRNDSRNFIDETLYNVLIPLSNKENCAVHRQIQDMCISALHRFKIQEIGTSNTFSWGHWEVSLHAEWNKYFYKIIGVDVTLTKNQIERLYDGCSKPKISLLWSNEKKRFLYFDVSYKSQETNKIFYTGYKFPISLNKFIIPVSQEPVKRSKSRQKAQKNGTYTGKTYNEIIGKQEKLLSFDIKLFKNNLDSFNGYELNGVSAPRKK